MITRITLNHSNITAYLVHQDVLYFTKSTQHPVGSLIEEIWTQSFKHVRAISRCRIYTDHVLTPLCDGMLKVAAKRATILTVEKFMHSLIEHNGKKHVEVFASMKSIPSPFPLPNNPVSHEEALACAKKIAKFSQIGIASVLLDENNKIVSHGWNDHSINKTLHAEVMLVKNYLAKNKKKIPKNHTLITTLQPCAMCAGYLYEYCDDFDSLEIIYETEDRGPFAQNSILVAGSSLWNRLPMKHSNTTLTPTPSKYAVIEDTSCFG